MKASFKPTTKIEACTDSEASRYALGSVCVSPVGADAVWLTATDGRCLAAIKEEGSAEEPIACPAAAIKAKGAKRGGPQFVNRENGHWIDRKNTLHNPPDAGLFPKCNDVIPDFASVPHDELCVVRLDAELLLNVARAVNRPECFIGAKDTAVYVIVPRGKTKDGQSALVKRAMGVLGSDGIGVLMPIGGEQSHGDEPPAVSIGRFIERANEYRAEFKPFRP